MTMLVFILALLVSFYLAWLGRKHSNKSDVVLANHKLNKWLIGLSTGATANSGFVVTGAVGLGYIFGFKWLLLPIGWFIGDLVFWHFFPHRLNEHGRKVNASTISSILTEGLDKRSVSIIRKVVALLTIVCLVGYTMAQWVAGQKILAGAFNIHGTTAVIAFACVVVAYTSIGGFRGSVYADTFQALIRILGTSLALLMASYMALKSPEVFSSNLNSIPAELNYFSLLGDLSLFSAVGFTLGYGFASLGFGLGQPQITTRYLAGVSPSETKAAKWIYISYVQYTWFVMTVFGVILRGVMPEIEDPEQGFAVFFQIHFPGVVAGIVLADIFATMASTSNSLLVNMSQTIVNDVTKFTRLKINVDSQLVVLTVTLGAITTCLSLIVDSTVYGLALTSVALLAAGLAPAMIIKLFHWSHSGLSLLSAIICGFTVAVIWSALGYGASISEALPGILVGLVMNFVVEATTRESRPKESTQAKSL